MKKCEFCGEDFEPTRPWQTFCTKKCRLDWWYRAQRMGGMVQRGDVKVVATSDH